MRRDGISPRICGDAISGFCSPWGLRKTRFRITFSARTKESIAKLGIPPEKFGIGLTGEVAKNEAEVAKNDTEVAKKIAEIKARVAGTVSAAEMRIIECIVEAPSISQAAIAERLGMTRQYIGRCMDDLQKRRIINRTRDPAVSGVSREQIRLLNSAALVGQGRGGLATSAAARDALPYLASRH